MNEEIDRKMLDRIIEILQGIKNNKPEKFHFKSFKTSPPLIGDVLGVTNYELEFCVEN